MSLAPAMPEPRYKIAVFERCDKRWSVSDPTYSWEQILDIVRCYREARLDLANVMVLNARWGGWATRENEGRWCRQH